jgi:hypothetical protein
MPTANSPYKTCGAIEGSPEFSELEKLVLRYSVAMTGTPVDAPDELFQSLQKHLSPQQLVELTSAIAWENYRARFDRACGAKAEGFCEGSACAVPWVLAWRPLAVITGAARFRADLHIWAAISIKPVGALGLLVRAADRRRCPKIGRISLQVVLHVAQAASPIRSISHLYGRCGAAGKHGRPRMSSR